LEDSDDGDEEGRELDYISDTSGSEESDKEEESQEKGVDEEQGLRDLLESGSESETEKTEDKEEEDEDEAEGSQPKEEEESESSDKKKKKKKKKKVKKEADSVANELLEKYDDRSDDEKMDISSESIESTDMSSGEIESAVIPGIKRKATSELVNLASSSNKKVKVEVSSVLLQSAAAEGITEEAVRRYLLRKPMTVTELLHKFKSKKTKISSQDMVNVIASILKKVNPNKRNQNQKMYLSLSPTKQSV